MQIQALTSTSLPSTLNQQKKTIPVVFLFFRQLSVLKLALLNLNMVAIFLKPLILRARNAGKIKGFRKMAKVLQYSPA